MANYLSPIGNGQQFIDSNGNPLNGALLFTYTAGSSTKRTTYTNSAGSGSHTNPIVLDVNGRPPSPIWLIGSSTYKLVLCPSNDTDPPVSAIYTWDDISGVNDTSVSIDQWVSGPTPTYVSATTLTLVGDQTTAFHVGRRVKTTDSGGTDYATIVGSVYAASTTLTLEIDSGGSLDSGLSAISYALISSNNSSVPKPSSYGYISTDAGATAGPSFTLDRNSASPANSDVLGAIPFKGRDSGGGTDTYAQLQGEIVDVTAASEDGQLSFQTAVAGTLATRGYLRNGLVWGSATGGDQGAGSINAAAVYDDGVLLTPATAANGASLPLLATVTANGTADNLEYAGIDDTYLSLLVVFDHIYMSSAGAKLVKLQFGDGGGYFTTNYEYHVTDTDPSSASYAALVSATGITTGILLANALDTTSTRGLNGYIVISRPGAATRHGAKIHTWEITNGGVLKNHDGTGDYTGGTGALTKFKVVVNDGTFFSAGSMYVYGFKRS